MILSQIPTQELLAELKHRKRQDFAEMQGFFIVSLEMLKKEFRDDYVAIEIGGEYVRERMLNQRVKSITRFTVVDIDGDDVHIRSDGQKLQNT